MSIFGWDYPAGCTQTPYDDDPPCIVCGKFIDDCTCKECPVCGDIGNPKCYKPAEWDETTREHHGMIDPAPIKCTLDLFLATGTMHEGEYGEVNYVRSMHSLERIVYKGTACGAWIDTLQPNNDCGGIIVGSIVEGTERCADPVELHFPFSENDFWNALEDVEEQCNEIWDDTHGCEKCWENGFVDSCGIPREFGDWPINPDCKHCGGSGEII